MRDPDLVRRAERAAIALERAWGHWRSVHGLGADPVPQVSSYVGYSLADPWGQPRVVFGVGAEEAERLAALLEGHDCVGPVHAEMTGRTDWRMAATPAREPQWSADDPLGLQSYPQRRAQERRSAPPAQFELPRFESARPGVAPGEPRPDAQIIAAQAGDNAAADAVPPAGEPKTGMVETGATESAGAGASPGIVAATEHGEMSGQQLHATHPKRRGAAKSAVPKLAVPKPAVPEPVVPEPVVPKPVVPKPALPNSGVPKPVAGKPGDIHSAAPEPALPQPELPRPATPLPDARYPDAPHPAVPRPAAAPSEENASQGPGYRVPRYRDVPPQYQSTGSMPRTRRDHAQPDPHTTATTQAPQT